MCADQGLANWQSPGTIASSSYRSSEALPSDGAPPASAAAESHGSNRTTTSKSVVEASPTTLSQMSGRALERKLMELLAEHRSQLSLREVEARLGLVQEAAERLEKQTDEFAQKLDDLRTDINEVRRLTQLVSTWQA